MREPTAESPLDQAVKRLDRAISQLEQRLAAGASKSADLFDQGSAQLAAELEKAKVREKELEAAGAEASAALGRAIAEIKSALANENSDEIEETEEA